MSHNTFSGARAIFRIDGVKIAFAANVEGDEETPFEPVDVLDNLEVEEHVPTAYRVSFSCGIFRTIRGTAGARAPKEGTFGSVKEMGLFPKAGQDVLNVLRAGTLTCTIEDRLTGKIVMQLEECKMTSNNFSVTARGIVSTNCRWVAKRMKDESETGA
jgi:hypothetical protein